MLIAAAKLVLQCLKIGFIGAGKVTQALAKSLVELDETLDRRNLYVTEIRSLCSGARYIENFTFWRDLGATWADGHRDLVVKSDIIILAVQPQEFMEVLLEAKSEEKGWNIKRSRKLFISVIKGMPLEYLVEHLQSITSKLSVARAMSNSLLAKGAGFTVYAMGPFDSAPIPDDSVMVEAFFSYGGNSMRVHESQIDAYSALIESGPSSAFTIVKSLFDGGMKLGMSPHLAIRLATQVTCGAAELIMVGLLKDDRSLPSSSHETKVQTVTELRNAICPPGGATIASLDILEKGSVKAIFTDAMEAVAKEMEKQTA